ncbi:MAG: hypothetical protein IJI12_08340 [Atopobiaceae bacterium]|nr:hypothetical protein [Atopobiaceae bacterium]
MAYGKSRTDPYLERLRAIQAEVAGIDMRLSALEAGYALDADKVDTFVRSQIAERPARYEDFLSTDEIRAITVRHTEALNRGVELDALDYGLAAICGVFSGLLDVFLVGAPSKAVAAGAAGQASDRLFDAVVIRFAQSVKTPDGKSWSPEGKKNVLGSAIAHIEKFRVGYDQATTKAMGGSVEHISMKNHHAKSLAHYPDVFGLIASICNQFTDTSSFFDVSRGEIIVVEGTGNGVELKGNTLTAKVFSGTVNWFMHCVSDMAGSSGSQGRGAGLPLPLTELFQLCDFGRFPNEKGQWQSLATVMTEVYEQGYDLRHGVATSFPVTVNDLLVRAIFTIKRHFADGCPWKNSLPKRESPEVQRMVTVGVGSMCLVDLGHAAATSWGNWVKFFSDLNLAAWARFGLQGANELDMMANRETRNLILTSEEISGEWSRLLERSEGLLK